MTNCDVLKTQFEIWIHQVLIKGVQFYSYIEKWVIEYALIIACPLDPLYRLYQISLAHKRVISNQIAYNFTIVFMINVNNCFTVKTSNILTRRFFSRLFMSLNHFRNYNISLDFDTSWHHWNAQKLHSLNRQDTWNIIDFTLIYFLKAL